MTGSIRRRGERSWELKFDDGRDSATGKRIIRYHSFKGTRREAERKLTELLRARDDGSYVALSKITVAEHVRARVQQWEKAGDISPKTAERYRELVENQIVPHIGAKLLQKLKPADLEAWHTILKATGRKDGEGGHDRTRPPDSEEGTRRGAQERSDHEERRGLPASTESRE
jgi:hypothetical protein